MAGLIRFFRGTVRFTASGGFPERFINLCASRGYPLWDVTRGGESCGFSTWAGLYRRLRPCARRAGVRLRVGQRRGLPFLLARHRGRWGLWAGAALCLTALAVASQFVWQVRVTGNSRLPAQTILEELERQGVRPGALRSSVDARGVERRMMMELEDLGWIAVNLRGTTADVHVQERVLPPALLDRASPCNVVAAQAGQILSMKVYVGQTMVAVGDAVAKGDMLVSGVVEEPDRDIHLVAARADVTAQTARSLTVQVPLHQTRLALRGVLRRYSLRIGSLELPLWVGRPPKGRFRLERMYAPVRFLGLPTPLAVGRRQYLLLQSQSVTLTPDQAGAQARQKLAALEAERFAGAQILSRSRHISVHAGWLTLRTDYTARENIALQSEIFTQLP